MSTALVKANTLERGGAPGSDETRGAAGSREHGGPGFWSVPALAGELVEVVYTPASAALTATVQLVRDAQILGEPCAWIASGESTFYPPDAERAGVDLASLMVVRVAGLTAAARAAEYLLRSGGFGLIVADFTVESVRRVDSRFAGRAVRLARAANTALVCLTRGGVLGSMVSLRVETRRERVGWESDFAAPGAFDVVVQVIKDRRNGPGGLCRERRDGPDGVR